MRRPSINRPFIAGMVTDQSASKIGPQNSAFAQDLIAPEGIARQRKGWAYDGTVADVADNLIGVYRNKFLLADATRTVTVDDDGDMFVHNPAGAGTSIYAGGVKYLPRCVYRDTVIWCAEDGLQPVVLYSGSIASANGVDDGVAVGAPDTPAQEARIKDLLFASDPGPGSYIVASPTTSSKRGILLFHRALETSTTEVTLEDILAGSADSYSSVTAYPIGTTYPCIPIYNAGTVTYVDGTNTATGYGTKWNSTVSLQLGLGFYDAMLVTPATGDAQHFNISNVASDTSLTMSGGAHADIATKANYAITRRCNFTDAAVHKGSLWGTGSAFYPNNVYVAPPGWNPSLPPGAALPYDHFANNVSSNANDFLMDSIAVPTAYEGDVNVAILSSPNPLLVLKRSAVYGIYGAFPNFSTDKIVDGVGCIDKRSAISASSGQFWAGEDDVYAYSNGQVIPLMEGKISREWQALIRDFDFGTSDYCAIGETYNHLIVSLVTGAGATNRCYVYDMRAQAWMSRFTNHKARYFFSSKVDGEAGELYWVGDNDQGRVMTSASVFDGTGTAKDGDGDSPRMQAWTPEGIDGTETIDNDARLLDLSVAHNIYDAGAAGSTSMAVSVVAGGSLEANASATKNLSDIDSDVVDRIDRTRYRTVNTKGRVQQVRLDVDTLGTNSAATKVEIHEITGTVRDRRSRT